MENYCKLQMIFSFLIFSSSFVFASFHTDIESKSYQEDLKVRQSHARQAMLQKMRHGAVRRKSFFMMDDRSAKEISLLAATKKMDRIQALVLQTIAEDKRMQSPVKEKDCDKELPSESKFISLYDYLDALNVSHDDQSESKDSHVSYEADHKAMQSSCVLVASRNGWMSSDAQDESCCHESDADSMVTICDQVHDRAVRNQPWDLELNLEDVEDEN